MLIPIKINNKKKYSNKKKYIDKRNIVMTHQAWKIKINLKNKLLFHWNLKEIKAQKNHQF